MKILAVLAILCIIPLSTFAQYAASTSGSTTAAAEINAKPTIQSSASAASGNCTLGKDIWIKTDGTLYLCTATNTWTALGLVASSTLTTPNIGAATGTSLLATGIVDGKAPVDVTTGASASLGGTYKSGYTFNQDATAGAAITYTLPTAAAGLQYCVGNSYNGSAANTGTLEILTSASGQFIIFTDGTLSATGGYVISGGAAGDFACVVGVDSTHWIFRPGQGIWAKH